LPFENRARLAHVRPLGLLALLALVLAAAAVAAEPAPNDPSWPQPALELVRVPEVWELTKGDPRIVIALVDTGVNPALADLAGNVVPGYDFVDNDPDPEDINGHGTILATEIAAHGNNREGIAGYCWLCRVMPVRVSEQGDADNGTIATGIRYAVDRGARIVNVSFADEDSGGPDSPLAAAVAYAQARNVLVVAAAGNSGSPTPAYPAAFPGVLSVTATTQDGRALEPWATYGPWVQLAAPGCQIVLASDTYYGGICGTSVTAPAVAGIAGLIMSMNPTLSARDVAVALRSSATPVSGISGGTVDAYAALAALGLAKPQPPRGPSNAAAGERSAKVVSGTFRGVRTIRTRVVSGRVDLTLDMPDVRGCTLALISQGRTKVALPASRFEIRLRQDVADGVHRIRISCTGKKPRPFTLRAPRSTASRIPVAIVPLSASPCSDKRTGITRQSQQ